MVREAATGRWLAHGPRDRRDPAGPLRPLLDQLSGPVLFLILIGSFLAVTMLVRGTYEGWR